MYIKREKRNIEGKQVPKITSKLKMLGSCATS